MTNKEITKEIMYVNNCDEDEAERTLEDLEFFGEEIEQGFYEDLKSVPEDNKFYYGWDWC